jgi:hypothetical protein|tara:strand:+ start:197 stop:1183 length:987 start_codon:yes stop_codon:yes gene_type:complete
MTKIVKYFKGGSLSGTFVIKKKRKLIVRKQVSLDHNREFGFQRWLSQLKKIQYYNSRIKNIFPDILDSGTLNQKTYFDIEYFKNYHNCFETLNHKKKIDTKKLLTKILNKSNKLYRIKIPTVKNNIQLYFEEEINQRVKVLKRKINKNFFKNSHIYYNDEKVLHLHYQLKFLREIFLNHSNLINETFVHGNLTLENILYNGENVIFIDPYEENYIDTIYNDYSQILQSCNSNYESLNCSKFKVKKNEIFVNFKISKNMHSFNKLFKKYLLNKYNFNEIILIRAFEVSQFIRMIPFKIAVNENKAILFYGLACKLIKDLKNDYKKKIKF